VRVLVMFSCWPACLHGSPHRAPRAFWAGVPWSWHVDLDSYEVHVISGASQWVEAALHARKALRAGVAGYCFLLCMLGGMPGAVFIFTSFADQEYNSNAAPAGLHVHRLKMC
jgi:hypothetical protein